MLERQGRGSSNTGENPDVRSRSGSRLTFSLNNINQVYSMDVSLVPVSNKRIHNLFKLIWSINEHKKVCHTIL